MISEFINLAWGWGTGGFFHWQNLNTRGGEIVGSGFWHGRCWWHFSQRGDRRSPCVMLSWNFWSRFCMAEVDLEDEGITFSAALPPVAFWLSLERFDRIYRMLPKKPLNDTNYKDTIVVDEREVGICIHDWTLRIKPWCKRNEWAAADPWWVRGVHFELNPFRWEHMRNEVRCAGGEWEPFVGSWEPEKQPDHRETFVFPYRYVRKNGEIQDRTATVYVERRAWRPRCLRWTGLIENVRTSIDVQFNDEIGERTGTWKGGTIGCGWDLKPGETPEAALRRMEAERKF